MLYIISILAIDFFLRWDVNPLNWRLCSDKPMWFEDDLPLNFILA